MKTVKEANGDLDKNLRERKDLLYDRAKLWKRYVTKIEKMNIPAYQPTQKNTRGDLIDKTDYSKLRKGLRESISAQKYASQGFVNIACDECKTMLFDAMVGSMNMSNPPNFWADCIGCGKRYPTDCRLRQYADPVMVES